jgi:deoxyribodipyrimidine photo-lyase
MNKNFIFFNANQLLKIHHNNYTSFLHKVQYLLFLYEFCLNCFSDINAYKKPLILRLKAFYKIFSESN